MTNPEDLKVGDRVKGKNTGKVYTVTEIFDDGSFGLDSYSPLDKSYRNIFRKLPTGRRDDGET